MVTLLEQTKRPCNVAHHQHGQPRACGNLRDRRHDLLGRIDDDDRGLPRLTALGCRTQREGRSPCGPCFHQRRLGAGCRERDVRVVDALDAIQDVIGALRAANADRTEHTTGTEGRHSKRCDHGLRQRGAHCTADRHHAERFEIDEERSAVVERAQVNQRRTRCHAVTSIGSQFLQRCGRGQMPCATTDVGTPAFRRRQRRATQVKAHPAGFIQRRCHDHRTLCGDISRCRAQCHVDTRQALGRIQGPQEQLRSGARERRHHAPHVGRGRAQHAASTTLQ